MLNRHVSQDLYTLNLLRSVDKQFPIVGGRRRARVWTAGNASTSARAGPAARAVRGDLVNFLCIERDTTPLLERPGGAREQGGLELGKHTSVQ